MFIVYLNMMDISFDIKSPFEFIIHDPIKPFLAKQVIDADVKVVFQPVDQLPEPNGGRWIEDRYFCGNCSFIRNFYNLPPYAMVAYDKDAIICHYLREFEHYVHSTGSLLNLVGMEAIFLQQKGFMLHASVAVLNGKAVLFTAPCGVGKSTQANLWEKVMGADILNGDRAGVRRTDGAWSAYGIPFAGTSGIYRNASAPIAAVVALAQGPENHVSKLRPVTAMAKILPEISCRRWDNGFMNEILDLVQDFLFSVPVYFLECRPDADAVHTLHNVLSKEGLL